MAPKIEKMSFKKMISIIVETIPSAIFQSYAGFVLAAQSIRKVYRSFRSPSKKEEGGKEDLYPDIKNITQGFIGLIFMILAIFSILSFFNILYISHVAIAILISITVSFNQISRLISNIQIFRKIKAKTAAPDTKEVGQSPSQEKKKEGIGKNPAIDNNKNIEKKILKEKKTYIIRLATGCIAQMGLLFFGILSILGTLHFFILSTPLTATLGMTAWMMVVFYKIAMHQWKNHIHSQAAPKERVQKTEETRQVVENTPILFESTASHAEKMDQSAPPQESSSPVDTKTGSPEYRP